MVCETNRMESTEYNRKVAEIVAAAIRTSGSNPTRVAHNTGMSQTDLCRKLKTLNGASFTVGNLAVIAAHLNTDVVAFFPPQVAA